MNKSILQALSAPLTIAVCICTFSLLGGSVQAQPFDPAPPPTQVPEPPPAPAQAPEPAQDQPQPPPPDGPADPYADLEERARAMAGWPDQKEEDIMPDVPAEPFPSMKAPHLLAAPTGHLLPAAVVQSTTNLDTGGSLGGSLRVGLGDVGEFGVETSPRIRLQNSATSTADTVQPFVLATFRMGVGEDRLFQHQPALALGFRKSFSRKSFGSDLRVAAIDFVASKTFGKTSLHAGGVFWDASIRDLDTDARAVLHEQGTRRQIRPFGGIEAEPIKDAHLLVDLYWVPLFKPYEASDVNKIKLRPTLSWGVRYKLGRRVSFESGVRVPDIGEANLLDAQIFGQLTLSTDKIRRALGVKK